MNEICMLSYYQKLEYFFVRRDFSIGRATNLRRNHFTLSVSASVYIPPVFCALRCLMTDGSIQLRAQPTAKRFQLCFFSRLLSRPTIQKKSQIFKPK
jgi:hypothetical protein